MRGFPGGSDSKESACNAAHWFYTCVEKIPWRREYECSFLAWKISWTEEPGGLQPMRLQRDGYD